MKFTSNLGLVAIFISTPFVSANRGAVTIDPPAPIASPAANTAACPQSTTALPAAIANSSWTAAYASASYPQDPNIIAQIINTLTLYPLAVDGGNFSALSLVFTEDVVADYPVAGLGILSPLSAVEQGIAAASQYTSSQHAFGTQIVQILSECHAKSLTYFTATLFGKGKFYGEAVYIYGQFQDTWVKVLNNEWRINTRNLILMGPNLGNSSVLDPQ